MASGRTTSGSGGYRKTTLKNGLRVVTEKIPSVRSISLGVWIDVGSRDETPKENGVSHLIEHMVFKGTKRRTAKQIAASLESVGGAINAFTSREQTCYTARIPTGHLETAVDVLADIICHATLTPVNLKREKLVICEEIKESIENPSDFIHDIFARTFWGEHPLGRPILGSIETVVNLRRSRVVEYIQRHYRAESVVIAASGSVSHEKLVKLVKDKFNFPGGTAEKGEQACRSVTSQVKLVPNENEQTHVCLGYSGFAYASKEKIGMLALTTYLGGGMSSVLFQKVREERGLAYSVYSFQDSYRDAGLFATYLATDKRRLGEALGIIRDELRRVKERRVPATRLDQIKRQIKGQFLLGLESTAAKMSRLARHELMLGKYVPIAHTMRKIDRVTPSEVQELARRVFDDSQLALAVLGPAERKALKRVI